MKIYLRFCPFSSYLCAYQYAFDPVNKIVVTTISSTSVFENMNKRKSFGKQNACTILRSYANPQSSEKAFA